MASPWTKGTMASSLNRQVENHETMAPLWTKGTMALPQNRQGFFSLIPCCRFRTPLYLSKGELRLPPGTPSVAGWEPPTQTLPDVFLCLDLAWSEPPSSAQQNGLKTAKKTFLSEDAAGDKYLCYLQAEAKRLAVVNYELGPSTGKCGQEKHYKFKIIVVWAKLF